MWTVDLAVCYTCCGQGTRFCVHFEVFQKNNRARKRGWDTVNVRSFCSCVCVTCEFELTLVKTSWIPGGSAGCERFISDQFPRELCPQCTVELWNAGHSG